MVFWKIYFWAYTILTVIGLFAYTQYAPLLFGDMLSLILGVLMLVGLYTFTFGKSVFSPQVWAIIFWAHIIFIVESILEIYVLPKDISNTYLFMFKSVIPVSANEILFGWLITLPGIYALYQIGPRIVSSHTSKKKK